jgi:glucose/arabinose dehydrogenase
MLKKILLGLVVLALIVVVGGWLLIHNSGNARIPLAAQFGPNPQIPDPDKPWVPTVNVAKAIGWKPGEAPTPAAGLKVNAFATGLQHPRWVLVLPNGDVLAAEADTPPKPADKGNGIGDWIERKVMARAGSGTQASSNRITLLRDTNGDGVADQRSVLVSGLNSPVGMALVGDQLYVAEADKLTRFPFKVGDSKVAGPGVKVTDLPGGPINHHWVKNVVAAPDGSKLYVSVGSNSNVGENGMAAEKERAAIWEVDPKTGQHRVFAYGLRNPNGMAWEPTSKMLWTVVNERDELGSDIVPDYLTGVDLGDFFGWPCFYWGGYPDSRVNGCDEAQAQYVKRPDYALGPHTASLGLAFATGQTLGPNYADGAFIGQHGSWNRKPKSGYKVIFVPFKNGRPAGKPVDILTGFLNADEEARGRPVEVAIAKDGALLVADDVGNTVWRVSGGK